MSVIDRMRALQAADPEGFAMVQQLARNARDETLAPEVRLRCAMVLGKVLGPLMMDGIRDEFLAEYAANPGATIRGALTNLQPKEEYRYIRGAKVKVLVDANGNIVGKAPKG